MSPPTSLLQIVPRLGQVNVVMRDPGYVENVIRSMMSNAQEKMQIVADFDRTLTKYAENGQICSTTHGVLEQSEFMPESFKLQANKLKDHYLPIEFDVNIPEEEKIPKMIEWWTKGHALLAETGLTKDRLGKMVAKSKAKLRTGCDWFFDTLNRLEIPLLIFSAGLGDVIDETIRQQAKFYDTNMKIVSNFLHFDESGKLLGIAGDEIIHTFNKNESAIHSSDYFYNLRHRENVLLLGDSLGDLHMSKGVENVQSILKIGFLNFKVEDNLDTYKEKYDIVILEDESLDVVNDIITAIMGLPHDAPSSS